MVLLSKTQHKLWSRIKKLIPSYSPFSELLPFLTAQKISNQNYHSRLHRKHVRHCEQTWHQQAEDLSHTQQTWIQSEKQASGTSTKMR